MGGLEARDGEVRKGRVGHGEKKRVWWWKGLKKIGQRSLKGSKGSCGCAIFRPSTEVLAGHQRDIDTHLLE